MLIVPSRFVTTTLLLGISPAKGFVPNTVWAFCTGVPVAGWITPFVPVLAPAAVPADGAEPARVERTVAGHVHEFGSRWRSIAGNQSTEAGAHQCADRLSRGSPAAHQCHGHPGFSPAASCAL